MVPTKPELVVKRQDGTTQPDGTIQKRVNDTAQSDSSHRFTQQLIALTEILLCSTTQFVLAPILFIAGIQTFDNDGKLSFTYVVTLSLMDTVLLIALIFLLLWIHREHPREFFLGPRPIRNEILVGGLLIPVVVLSVLTVFALIQSFASWLHNVPENPLEALIRSPTNALIFAFVSIVAGGVREEMQRAFILRRFEQHLGGGLVGLVTFSVIFGLAHRIQGWDASIITGLLGAFWGATYLVRRSIIAPVISHSGLNVAEIMRYLIYS